MTPAPAETTNDTEDVIEEIVSRVDIDYGHAFEVVEWSDEQLGEFTQIECSECGQSYMDSDDLRNNGRRCPFA